jgi:hypothetical protein
VFIYIFKPNLPFLCIYGLICYTSVLQIITVSVVIIIIIIVVIISSSVMSFFIANDFSFVICYLMHYALGFVLPSDWTYGSCAKNLNKQVYCCFCCCSSEFSM